MAFAANKHSASNSDERNYTMMQAFEWYTPGGGNHWKWLADNASHFADIGITAVWIPPPTKGAAEDSTGYDIYDLWDLGEFPKNPEEPDKIRTKYGTREELEVAMGRLRENGIAIYIDAVLNHKMGADKAETFKVQPVAEDDRSRDVGEAHDIEGWTNYTFPGRKGKYSDLQWNFNHFTAVDYDNKTGDKGIFRILGRGKRFAEDTDDENGNYDFLMGSDVDHAHPDVSGDMIKWGQWLVRTFPISGFRFDAIKHFSSAFLRDFIHAMREEARKVREEQGKEKLDESEGPICFSVGEYWKDDVDTCLRYLGDFGDEQFSLFDAPLHYNFVEAGDAGNGYDLRKIFDGSIVQKRPIDAVTLVENHDTQPGQSLASPVSATFKPLAYATILLRQDGYPCVFLGDLDGCHADGDSQPSVPPMSSLSKFIKARKYFAFGEQRDYWDHPTTVGWVRAGTSSHPDGCAVVMSVGEEKGTKRMEVGTIHAGEKFVDALGWTPDVEITIGEDGWAEFTSPAHSVAIWVNKEAKNLQELRKD